MKRKGVNLKIMKEYVLRNRKGLLLVLIAVLIMGVIEFQNIKNTKTLNTKLSYNVITDQNKEMKVITDEELLNNFLENNQEKINFYAKAFRIESETLTNLIKENYHELEILDNANIDTILIDYLFELEKDNSKLFNFNIVSSNPDKEYMIALINYFTNIYPEVDTSLACAIAKIESGYRSQYMIKNNNIFGGMSKGKLIKYRTIEYGILKYIKLLNDRYYAKGLNTIETIGKVYNPVYENGIKKASPTWVVNVKKAIGEYSKLESEEINRILGFTVE